VNDDFEQSIDKIIREAREKGAFDDLAGKGKPIRWDDDSLVPDDQRLANQVLKNAGFVPDWVMESQEIDQAYLDARKNLKLAKTARDEGRLDEAGWQAAKAHYTQQIGQLNRRILSFNMRAPSSQLQRGQYPVEPPSQP
jgi:hypothetical protein